MSDAGPGTRALSTVEGEPPAGLAVVRLLTELVVLVAVFWWGLGDGAAARWVLAVGATAAVAAVWGRFVAPKSSRRLHDPARLVVEIAVFLVGGAAAAAAWGAVGGLVVVAIGVGTAILLRVLSSDRRRG